MSDSHCIYCNSTTFGKPCLFSPTNTHVHMSSDRCIYCNSPSSGSGCVYNPYSNIHIKGPEFLNRSNIQSEKTVLLKHMLNNVNLDVNESYKSPLDRLYKRLSYLIAHTSEPLLETLSLQETPNFSSLPKEQMLETFHLKNKIIQHLKELKNTLLEASYKLPPELVEETILDAILVKDEN